MEFMPWYFAHKNKVDAKIFNKIMLYGAYDLLSIICFFEKKENLLITSHSNKEIAFLIHKKLGFKFKFFMNLLDAMTNSDSNIFELYIYTDDLVVNKEKIKKYISILEGFENRN